MYETLSVFDNVMISLAGHRLVVQSLFHKHTAADQDRVVEILDFIGLLEKAEFPADALSHGERQWLEMGMLIAADPKLLLLDEPTTGMTEADKQKTADLIQRIAERHTVLLVEHDMHVVRRLGNFVTVLHQGGILAEGLLGGGRRQRGGEAGLSRAGEIRRCLRSTRSTPSTGPATSCTTCR